MNDFTNLIKYILTDDNENEYCTNYNCDKYIDCQYKYEADTKEQEYTFCKYYYL